LTAGRLAEAEQLDALGSTGKVSFTPTQAQIDSAAFKVIVGDAKYTPSGVPVGTVYDATIGNGLGELKTGTSVLDSSYKLRLQTYGTRAETVASRSSSNPVTKWPTSTRGARSGVERAVSND
jgi:filamentous hemagglutinin